MFAQYLITKRIKIEEVKCFEINNIFEKIKEFIVELEKMEKYLQKQLGNIDIVNLKQNYINELVYAIQYELDYNSEYKKLSELLNKIKKEFF